MLGDEEFQIGEKIEEVYGREIWAIKYKAGNDHQKELETSQLPVNFVLQNPVFGRDMVDLRVYFPADLVVKLPQC